MKMNEAQEVSYQYRSKWKTVGSAYFPGKQVCFMYVCVWCFIKIDTKRNNITKNYVNPFQLTITLYYDTGHRVYIYAYLCIWELAVRIQMEECCKQYNWIVKRTNVVIYSLQSVSENLPKTRCKTPEEKSTQKQVKNFLIPIFTETVAYLV